MEKKKFDKLFVESVAQQRGTSLAAVKKAKGASFERKISYAAKNGEATVSTFMELARAIGNGCEWTDLIADHATPTNCADQFVSMRMNLRQTNKISGEVWHHNWSVPTGNYQSFDVRAAALSLSVQAECGDDNAAAQGGFDCTALEDAEIADHVRFTQIQTHRFRIELESPSASNTGGLPDCKLVADTKPLIALTWHGSNVPINVSLRLNAKDLVPMPSNITPNLNDPYERETAIRNLIQLYTDAVQDENAEPSHTDIPLSFQTLGNSMKSKG